MKTLLSICLIIMLSLSMISCQPKSEVVDDYFYDTEMFECTVVSLKEPTYQDTSRFMSEKYYVLANDIYNAQRLFDQTFADRLGTLNGAETHWATIPLAGRMDYPYVNE